MTVRLAVVACALMAGASIQPALPAGARADPVSLLDSTMLVTWYGNPHSAAMGVLGQQSGAARVAALRRQADAYQPLTGKRVLPAYHLVAVVAQRTPGADAMWRRRESASVIQALLEEARASGFALVLDVQPGRAGVRGEVEALRGFLAEPDVHLALDPEFDMTDTQVPGRVIGSMPASEINAALDVLERIRSERNLPPKVLIVHQFTLAMLPDKRLIKPRPGIDLVLNMDGFGSRPLKLASYRTVFRQHALPYAGVKLFYRQDVNLFEPAQVVALKPLPSVVIYQ